MFYGFDTSDEDAAIGALLVYGIYRSRDQERFKVTPDMWGIIERAVKSSAKRAMDLNDFIERLKPKLHCSTVHPRWMWDGQNTVTMALNRETGELYEVQDKGKRMFWTGILEQADHRTVLDRLYRRTALIIALVRERLERERPLEAKGFLKDEGDEIEADRQD